MTDLACFVFLNTPGCVDDPAGWNDSRLSKLWLYNLHYFDDLNAERACERVRWHTQIIERWVRENPVGSGVGWDPYPTSLRIVNWIKWLMRGNDPVEGMVRSLSVQLAWLRSRVEWHLLGNHLVANAKALITGGLFFTGEHAERWYAAGRNILQRQLRKQILPDGGHFELSPMYHSLAFEDLLDISNVHAVYDRTVPNGLTDAIERMRAWAMVMRHPDGELPFFNDCAHGVAPALDELDDYAERLGIHRSTVAPERQRSAVILPDSGYARLTASTATLFADIAAIGPGYLPAHAHADTLSFELSLGSRRVVVNAGTSEYGVSSERHRQRSTPAHSTVVIDGENSSEVWAGFRAGRRARIIASEIGEQPTYVYADGAHDGYRGLRGRPLHRRAWRLFDNRLEIIDTVTGNRTHTADIVFLLHPGLIVREQDAPVGDSAAAVMTGHDGSVPLVEIVSKARGITLHIEPFHYCPEFGVRIPSRRLRFRVRQELPLRVTTVLTWHS